LRIKLTALWSILLLFVELIPGSTGTQNYGNISASFPAYQLAHRFFPLPDKTVSAFS
jgi:hypothetical protein